MTNPEDPNQESRQPPPYGRTPGFGQPPVHGGPGPGEPGAKPPPPGSPAYEAPGFGQPAPPGQPYGAYPAAPPPPQGPIIGPGGLVLDPESGVYLPPGTQLASVGRRIGAYFLAIPLFIVTLGIGYIVWGLIVWSKSTTPALQVLGMKVWRVDQPSLPSYWRMVLREVVGRIVEGILGLITQVISFVLFVSTDKRQALHDMIASTTVLHDPNKVLSPPKA
jgi:uncharacterized RDD family membrane protein YckC